MRKKLKNFFTLKKSMPIFNFWKLRTLVESKMVPNFSFVQIQFKKDISPAISEGFTSFINISNKDYSVKEEYLNSEESVSLINLFEDYAKEPITKEFAGIYTALDFFFTTIGHLEKQEYIIDDDSWKVISKKNQKRESFKSQFICSFVENTYDILTDCLATPPEEIKITKEIESWQKTLEMVTKFLQSIYNCCRLKACEKKHYLKAFNNLIDTITNKIKSLQDIEKKDLVLFLNPKDYINLKKKKQADLDIFKEELGGVYPLEEVKIGYAGLIDKKSVGIFSDTEQTNLVEIFIDNSDRFISYLFEPKSN